MKILGNATERDMAWEWAIAEVESSRFGGGYACLDPRIRSALVRGFKSELSPRDLNLVKKVVRTVRMPLLEDLIRLGTEWKRAELEVGEVTDLRVINWPYLVELGPSRTIGGVSRFLDSGGVPPHDPAFGKSYRTLRVAYDRAKMRGAPILISEDEKSPLEVLEGYTRLAVIASRQLAGEPNGGSIQVIAGFTPRLREWHLWQVHDGRWIRTAHHLM
jgi:hypothetical protein